MNTQKFCISIFHYSLVSPARTPINISDGVSKTIGFKFDHNIHDNKNKKVYWENLMI